jgi:hypothetical protein
MDVEFEIITVVKVPILVFRVVKLVGRYQCFGGTHCPYLQMTNVHRWKKQF